MTKEEHDLAAELRGRPLTWGSMNVKPRDMRAAAPDVADVIDERIGRIDGSALTRFAARWRARGGDQ